MTTTTAARTIAHVSPPRSVRPTPAWWADVVGLAAGVSVLVVIALWARNAGLQQLSATESPPRWAG